MLKIGILYGIGVGPGDPELITFKGVQIIKSVPIVAFPAGLNDQAGIAQSIVEQWLQPHQRQLPLIFPYVHDEQLLRQAWTTAAKQIWKYLSQGEDVAFVSEGDVSFYSTFTYLSETLQSLHPEVCIQTVPGICSPLAAAAVLGIPLTIKAQRLVVLPILYDIEELEFTLKWADVVVLMKVSSVYTQVWEVLQQQGLLNRSWVVERATLPNQLIYQGLSDLPHLNLSYFSLLIVQTIE